MKSKKIFEWFLLYCAIFILSGCLFHRPAFYPPQVLMKNGVPCFSVTNNREARATPHEISVIDVISVNNNNYKLIWNRTFPPNPPIMTLSPYECLSYGAGTEDAPKLLKGFRYKVFMNSYLNGNNRRYHAYFCLYQNDDGETEIHHVEWSNKLKGFDWRICEKYD